MKKFLLTLLIVTVMITSAVLSACDKTVCDHEVDSYLTDTSTCTEDGIMTGTCKKCGQKVTVTSPAHHRFDELGVCTVCSYEKWDGESVPTVDQLDEYAQKYLPNIQADSYVDFATAYDIDLEEHPDLYDSGIFWCYYDETVGAVKEVSMRDHDKVDELIENGIIDKNKPTTIFTHGLGVNTYKKVYHSDGVESMCSEIYDAPTGDLDPNDPAYADYVESSSGQVNLNLVYLKNGYNVINFSYRRFADESAKTRTETKSDGIEYEMVYANNMVTEAKIYSTEGPAGMRYRYASGNFSDGDIVFPDEETPVVRKDIDFTIGEFYAAEYVRMFNYMVQKGVFDEDTVIQVSGHSMGGVVTVIGNYLVSELVRVGQIPSYYLADRMILGDTYLGVYSVYGENIPDYSDLKPSEKFKLKLVEMIQVHGYKVHWTGKKLDGCGTFGTFVTALRQLVRVYDLPVEYYIDASLQAFPTLPAGAVRHLVWSLCANQVYKFDFPCNSTHNCIREYRVVNITPSLTAMDESGAIAVSTSLSDDEIRSRRGKMYYQVQGSDTPTLTDDVFRIYTIDEYLSK